MVAETPLHRSNAHPAEAGAPSSGRRRGALASLALTAGLLAPAFVMTPAEALSPTLAVNAADDVGDGTCDSSHCSLRDAINAANANSDHDVIHFAIAGSGLQVISTTALPTATHPVTIDATTQTGYAGSPVVQIVAGSQNGLQVNGAGSVVRGLAITKAAASFPSSGLVVAGPGTTVEDNHLNVNAAGNARSEFNVALDLFSGGHRVAGNVIASNNYGILMRGGGAGTGSNDILGNLIGTDATGTVALSNPNSGPGIELRPDQGGNLFHGNVISSHYAGLTIGGSSNNVVTGNRIGTDITGTVDLGNRAGGLAIGNYGLGGTILVPTGNRIGGTSPGERNVISGNGEPNVVGTGITVGGADNVVIGNYIGTDASGQVPLPNARGVQVQQGTGIRIGGSVPGEGNVISGNRENGLQFSFKADDSVAHGNLIGVAADGVSPLGNGASGVAVSGLSDGAGVTIGGAAEGEGNEIAHNGATYGSSGVFVNHTSRYVTVSGNSSHDNDELGIDLLETNPADPINPIGWGPSPNDGGSADDSDGGGNDLVNFPVLDSVTPGPSNTTVSGSLDAAPNESFRVEVFASATCDDSGYGEGESFLGATSVSTDANGETAFNATVTSAAPGSAITATATDSSGNTSEFSACVFDPRPAEPDPGRVTIVKRTDPAGGTGFTFTGPAGASAAGDGTLGGGGDTVVFQRGGDGLFLLDVGTMTETLLGGTEGGTDPEFSPDSSKIAYGNSQSLAVYDLSSDSISVLTTDLHARAPSWSPDGGWIIFHASDDLHVVPSDGSEPPTQLTSTLLNESFPIWGADGRIVWRTNAASPNVRVATFDETTKALVGETGLTSFQSQFRAMHWSPDQQHIASGGAVNSASDTYLHVLTDGGSGTWTAAQLTDDGDPTDKSSYDTDPTWSPDGDIIYAGRTGTGPTFDVNLYRISPDASADGWTDPQLFHEGTGNESGPDWGQAGTTATYTLGDGGSIGGLVPARESVTFSEHGADGYVLDSIVCDSASAVTDVAGGSVTITPGAGEHVTCTFTNVPANTAPTVAVTGIGSASYELGVDPAPAPACSVEDAEDGSVTGVTPTVTGPVGPLAHLELGTVTVTCSYTDGGGLTDEDIVTYAVTDTTGPSLSGAPTSDPNAAGWYNGPVTIQWTASDLGVGIDPSTMPADGVIASEGVAQAIGASVSDLAGNSASAISQPAVSIDLTAPATGEPIFGTNPIAVGGSATFTSAVSDNLSGVVGGEYFIGFDPGQGAGTATALNSSNDTVSGTVAGLSVGVHELFVRAVDKAGNWSDPISAYVVVYDPDGGFVTGGGWIDSPAGAYVDDPSATGRANFGFVSKYKKGASEPTGNTEFQFKAGDLNFHSSSYQWLVVSGAKATYKGTGSINGGGDYGFMLTATDSARSGGGPVDTFRIKIWDRANGDAIVYDNQIGADDTSDAGTALGGGNIVVHTKK